MLSTFQYHLPRKEVPRKDQLDLSAYILEHAEQVSVPHQTSTSREAGSRTSSTIGKLSLLNNPELPLSPRILHTVKAIYEVNRRVAEAVLEMDLRELPTRHAAVAHVYHPGDEAGEAHEDIFPTSPNYLDGDEGGEGGPLFVGDYPVWAMPRGSCIPVEVVKPIPGTAVAFAGIHRIHQAASLPSTASRPRVSVNTAFLPPDDILRTLDPTHPRMVELAKVYEIPGPLQT